MLFRFFFAILFFTCLAGGDPASSAEIKTVATRDGKIVIYLNGAIVPGDNRKLVGLIRQANEAGVLFPVLD